MNDLPGAPNAPATDAARRAQAWFAVVRAYQACERRFGQLLEGLGLTIPQFDALCAVEDLGAEATPARIARRLLVTKGNITPLLRRLQERRWVVADAHPSDRRSLCCRLTSAGRTRIARARRAADAFIAAQLAPFDDATLAVTAQHMERMRGHLDRLDPTVILAAVASPTTRPIPEHAP